MVGWKPVTRVTLFNLFRVQKVKGQGHRPINAVTDNAPYAGQGH